MKRYLIIILMTFLTLSVLIVCVKQVSSANTPDDALDFKEMPDSSFSKEDYQKLLALQFDGYEDMTVATEEDYRSLLALKTPNYQNMSIADFLTAEELSFVKLTVFLSGMENGKYVQSIYSGYVMSWKSRKRLRQCTVMTKCSLQLVRNRCILSVWMKEGC